MKPNSESYPVVVIISANSEWRALRSIFPDLEEQPSPLGSWLRAELVVAGQSQPIAFFHGGWGKISAAASAQYVIDRWSPRLLVNLGTCGGFEGEIERGDIVLVQSTLVYDILEQMGDGAAAIAHYTTEIDLSWLKGDYPHPVRVGLLVSADRDLVASEVAGLKARYGASAGDWESGAIAFVAVRNDVRLLILRGVSDLVGSQGGEAYDGGMQVFHEYARKILERLVQALPAWLEKNTFWLEENRS